MYKIGGAWIWRCEHPAGSVVGDTFHETDWHSAWNACLGAAVKHALLYHADVEPIETIELS